MFFLLVHNAQDAEDIHIVTKAHVYQPALQVQQKVYHIHASDVNNNFIGILILNHV